MEKQDRIMQAWGEHLNRVYCQKPTRLERISNAMEYVLVAALLVLFVTVLVFIAKYS